jgi:hypothetical protein
VVYDSPLAARHAHCVPLWRGTHGGVSVEHGVVAVCGRVKVVHGRCPDASHDAGRTYTSRALFGSRYASVRVDRLVVALRCPRARLGRWRGPRRVARNAREGVSAPETSRGCGALVTSRLGGLRAEHLTSRSPGAPHSHRGRSRSSRRWTLVSEESGEGGA